MTFEYLSFSNASAVSQSLEREGAASDANDSSNDVHRACPISKRVFLIWEEWFQREGEVEIFIRKASRNPHTVSSTPWNRPSSLTVFPRRI